VNVSHAGVPGRSGRSPAPSDQQLRPARLLDDLFWGKSLPAHHRAGLIHRPTMTPRVDEVKREGSRYPARPRPSGTPLWRENRPGELPVTERSVRSSQPQPRACLQRGPAGHRPEPSPPGPTPYPLPQDYFANQWALRRRTAISPKRAGLSGKPGAAEPIPQDRSTC
jgi:hypothetical protein